MLLNLYSKQPMKLAQGKGQVLFTKPTRKVDTGVFKVQIPTGEAFLRTALGLKPSEKMNHDLGRPVKGYNCLPKLLSV